MGRPVPLPSLLTAPFWEATREGRLVVQQCVDCEARFFTPAPVCPLCLGDSWRWVESPGTGTVYSYTHVARTPYSEMPPYVLAAVDLDDGWTIMTHIVDCAPETVRIGMPVRVTFTRLTDEITLPTFAPDEHHRTSG